MTKWWQICRVNKVSKAAGIGLVQLQEAVESYDPTLHEAPIVIGHPRDNEPAYGWIEALSLNGSTLQASPRQIDADFAELMQAGRYKKVSASFYMPGHPNNPAPGQCYFRHLAVLGAQPPAIKGLNPINFNDSTEEGIVIVELSEQEFSTKRNDVENGPSPGWDPSLETSPTQRKDSQSKWNSTVDLSEREKTLSEREQQLAEREAEADRRDIVSFAEGLCNPSNPNDLRIPPAFKSRVVDCLMATPNGTEVTVDFAEADGKTVQLSPRQGWQKLLGDLPKGIVNFNEVAPGDDVPDPPASDPDARAKQLVELVEKGEASDVAEALSILRKREAQA